MEKIKAFLKFVMVLMASILPAYCHYKVTGPLLWSHHSSEAFRWWVVLWAIDIGVFALTFAVLYSTRDKKS